MHPSVFHNFTHSLFSQFKTLTPLEAPNPDGTKGREEASGEEARRGEEVHGGRQGSGGEEAKGRKEASEGGRRRRRREEEEEKQEERGDIQDLHLQGSEAGSP